ncbi:hypothetical protein [Rathayibacter rathayi]|uniref:hypothetical protein n=1 Tax=Rathayibacter rathayi TaxID=33887 RepID=UPI0011B09CFD|nr:hypothetical protein [Rathayibacter rathayi]
MSESSQTSTKFSLLRHTFAVEDLRVLSLSASEEEAEHKHVKWFVSYDPEIWMEGELPLHVVIATLNATLEGGRADITVGGLFSYIGEEDIIRPSEEYRSALASSSALETLYDYARTTVVPLLAVLEIEDRLPSKAPTAEISLFADDDDDVLAE